MSQDCYGMDVVKNFYNDVRMAKMKCLQSSMPDSTAAMMPTMMPMQPMPTQVRFWLPISALMSQITIFAIF